MIERIRRWLGLAPRVPNAGPAEAGADAPPSSRRDPWRRIAGVGLLVLVLIGLGVGWYWSREPTPFWVNAETPQGQVVPGFSTVDTLMQAVSWLLEKPGGYLSNDVLPPGVWLDNMPSFEYGVLVQSRDLARILRNNYSRSQSQSTEDNDLALAEPALNVDNESWLFPPAENRFRDALGYLDAYKTRLVDADPGNALFFPRADNLQDWLAVAELRLGNLSQRLSASVGQVRVNTDFAGVPGPASGADADPAAAGGDVVVRTPWLEIDDVFYEGRGTAWALLLFMRAAQFDFQRVLEDKNAVVSVRQVIRELEEGLKPVRSPMILNGQGFGMFPNHSLVLASYLSRAHTAVADLRRLLEQG